MAQPLLPPGPVVDQDLTTGCQQCEEATEVISSSGKNVYAFLNRAQTVALAFFQQENNDSPPAEVACTDHESIFRHQLQRFWTSGQILDRSVLFRKAATPQNIYACNSFKKIHKSVQTGHSERQPAS
jgi:hypothetical protein